MSAKRQATTELNHENWDQEDEEPEVTEGFKMASKDVLQKRVIRTAKRRFNPINSEGQKSVFSGFGGFNKTQKTSFDFLANLTNGKTSTNTNKQEESSSLFSSKGFPSQSASLFTTSDISNKPTNTAVSQQEGTSSLFTSNTFTNQSTGLFTQTDISKPNSSLFEKTNVQTDSSINKPVFADNKLEFKNSESPFKVQPSSTPAINFNFPLNSNSGNASSSVSQKSNSVFGGQAENIFAKNSVKMSPSSTFTASPTTKTPSVEENEKKDAPQHITIKCDKSKVDEKTLKYYKHLAGLNISLSEWIKKNIDESPLCILSPIFQDYEKHLKEIQDEYFNRDGAQGDFEQNLKSSVKEQSATPTNIFSQKPVTTPNNTTTLPAEDKKSANSLFGTTTFTSTTAKDLGTPVVPKVQSPTSSSSAQSPKQGFLFGSSLSTSSSAAQSPKQGFLFGSSTVPESTSASTAQSSPFGGSAIPASTSSSITQSPKQGFSFGSSTVPESTSTSTAQSPKQTVPFGGSSIPVSTSSSSTQSPKLGFSFGSSTVPQSTPSSTGHTSLFGGSTIPASTPSSSTQSPKQGFSFGSSTLPVSTSSISSGGITFGISSAPQTTSIFATKPIVSNTNGSSQFSFGSGKPFSFNSNIQRKEETNEDTNTKEDEDEPPKVEYTPIVEENSVYDKKCKIFVKKDNNFVDKGVGTLYIKKIEESGKHQLLVRANTTLGNILLNLVLSSSIPTQRMGKNNVMLVCIPTPDTQPPPTPVLIRVKTSEEADDLLEKLNNYKQ